MSETITKPTIDTPLRALHAAAGATIGAWFGCALPDRFRDDWQAEYRAARESVALIDKNYRAYFRFVGPDRVRYLNAIFTNDIKDLAQGHGVVSLLLSPQGRILAELKTCAEPESLLSVSYAMIRETLLPTLEKFIIMDDVTLTDETDQFGSLAIEGPGAASLIEKLTGTSLSSLSELSFQEISLSGISCRLTKRSPGGVAGAEFLSARADLPALWQSLSQAVQQAGGHAVGYQALNALRLEQGIPWFGYDFGEKQIPHEAGLEHSHISYTKGCYTGQEIVERVRSRGQVNRVRALVKFDGVDPPIAGTSLIADDKEVGQITRSAFSPALQAPIAMAYLRREKSTPGTQLSWGGSSKATVIRPPLAITN